MKLIYFHGGGLVSGHKDDLPKHIRDFFENLGFEIIALDYPLAPAHTIDDIISWCLENIPEGNDHVYLGRSAGVFLMFACAIIKPPHALINFYGYARIKKDWMKKTLYQDLPKVSYTNYLNYKGPIPFSAYVYLRQQALWYDALQTNEKSLDLCSMPPTFIWHSLLDPDVPYKEAKWIHEQINETTLITSFLPKHEIDLIEFDAIKDALNTFLLNFVYPKT